MTEDGWDLAAVIAAASTGDQAAWRQIVDRYAPLLAAVLRRYPLTAAAREDVAQTVWLRLVEHLDDLREPRALPRWMCTTAKRECLSQLRTEGRATPRDPADGSWQLASGPWQPRHLQPAPPEEGVLLAERRDALLAGLAELPTRQRRLLVLLSADPPATYHEIAEKVGIPIGSIGPTRARALERLRATESVRAWINLAQPAPTEGGERA